MTSTLHKSLRSLKMTGRQDYLGHRSKQSKSDVTKAVTMVTDMKCKQNLQINGKRSRKESVHSNGRIASPYPELSPVVHVLDSVDLDSGGRRSVAAADSCSGHSGGDENESAVLAFQSPLHVSMNVLHAPHANTGTPHDVSDESGIEEPEMVRNIPLSEEEGEQDGSSTRKSSKLSVCSDSGSESPDATNIIPSPSPAMETCLFDQSLSCVKMEKETETEDVDVEGCTDDGERTPSPIMPCLELEMPILTMEMPMLTAKAISRSATPTTPVSCSETPIMPDSSESIADEGLRHGVACYEDVEQTTTAVSSTSDEYPPVRQHCFQSNVFLIQSDDTSNNDDVMNRKISTSSQQKQDLQSQVKSEPKNFLTEFNKFIKKFDAKKVNYQRCRSENRAEIKKENIHKDQPFIGGLSKKSAHNPKSNPSSPCADNPPKPFHPGGNPPKPLSTSNPPASPKRKARVRTGMRGTTGHVAPIYFTPQNLYEMFVNAYWTEHAMDHPKKDQVLQDAILLWRQKYCKQKDPSRNGILRFLDRQEAKMMKRSERELSSPGRRQSAESVSCVRKMTTARRASASSPVRERKAGIGSSSPGRRRASIGPATLSTKPRPAVETSPHIVKPRASQDVPAAASPVATISEDKEAEWFPCDEQMEETDEELLSVSSRPKRRRVSNIRYDTEEFALGDMSELEELETVQEMAREAPSIEQSSDLLLLSETEVDVLYRDWRPPSSVDVSELLANSTLLMSLKHKVVELLQIVFPYLEYPPHLSMSVTALLQTLDRIEAAATDMQTPDEGISEKSVGATTPCRVVLCQNPRKCLYQLRERVCHFLCVILPELTLEDSFDRRSDSVEELLDEIIASNKQALQPDSAATLREQHTPSPQQSDDEEEDVHKTEISPCEMKKACR